MTVLLPRSLDDVCAELAARPDAELLAGGTDLMVGVNAGRHHLTTVIALDQVDELRAWRRVGDAVELGAGMTYAELGRPDLARLVPVLAQAARTVGSPQIRNAGTLGGNLATASPAGDTLPGLAALDAVVLVRSLRARREIPIADFFIGPKRSALAAGEVIAARAGSRARRSPGVPQGGHPQRHGHRRGQRGGGERPRRPVRSGWGWARWARRRGASPRPRPGWPGGSAGPS